MNYVTFKAFEALFMLSFTLILVKWGGWPKLGVDPQLHPPLYETPTCVPINECMQKGETALILACKMKNLKFVKKLLSMGANPDIANNVSPLTQTMAYYIVLCLQVLSTMLCFNRTRILLS